MTRSPYCATRSARLGRYTWRTRIAGRILARLSGPGGPDNAGLELMLGEPGAQLTTASHELLGAGLCGPMHRMVASAVAPAGHRERIFPGGHEGLQLGLRTSQLC